MMRAMCVMRWILVAIACLLAGGTASVRVQAEGLVSIDTERRYEGMNASFAKGYLPSVRKDTLRLVVPFVAKAPLSEEALYVGVSFEREENAPFVFRNYRKRVKKSGAGVYLYRCKLRLRRERVNGQYPLHLTVWAQVGEELVSQEFTVYVEISDGKPSAVSGGSMAGGEEFSREEGTQDGGQQESEAGEHEAEVWRQPRVLLVKSCLRKVSAAGSGQPDGTDLREGSGEGNGRPEGTDPREGSGEGNGQPDGTDLQKGSGEGNGRPEETALQAGGSAVWTVTAKNCSGSQGMENVKVTLLYEGADLFFDKQAWYFERVDAGGSMDLSQVISAGVKAAAGRALVQLQFEYEDKKGNAYSSTETVYLSVRQVQKAQLSGLSFPELIYESDTGTLSFQVQNTGLAVLYNARVRMEAAGLFPEGEMFLGNVEPGTSADGEIRVFAGTLDMDADGNFAEDGREKYGDTAARVYFSFEAEEGNVTQQEFSFHTAIQKPETVELKVDNRKEETNQWWITIVFFVVLLLVLIIIWLYLRMKYYQRRGTVYEGTKPV